MVKALVYTFIVLAHSLVINNFKEKALPNVLVFSVPNKYQHNKELKDFLMDPNMSENEQRLGNALVELFENYENIFIGNDNNKFNKKSVRLGTEPLSPEWQMRQLNKSRSFTTSWDELLVAQ